MAVSQALISEFMDEAAHYFSESSKEIDNSQKKGILLALLSIAASLHTQTVLAEEINKKLQSIDDTLEAMRQGE